MRKNGEVGGVRNTRLLSRLDRRDEEDLLKQIILVDRSSEARVFGPDEHSARAHFGELSPEEQFPPVGGSKRSLVPSAPT